MTARFPENDRAFFGKRPCLFRKTTASFHKQLWLYRKTPVNDRAFQNGISALIAKIFNLKRKWVGDRGELATAQAIFEGCYVVDRGGPEGLPSGRGLLYFLYACTPLCHDPVQAHIHNQGMRHTFIWWSLTLASAVMVLRD